MSKKSEEKAFGFLLSVGLPAAMGTALFRSIAANNPEVSKIFDYAAYGVLISILGLFFMIYTKKEEN